ncbi:hypothetical protein C8R43DRAFT_940397 [Mycena crocata]|nr:hypothetical protein C8R43DRAFT_940397 [Mycena crocata]
MSPFSTKPTYSPPPPPMSTTLPQSNQRCSITYRDNSCNYNLWIGAFSPLPLSPFSLAAVPPFSLAAVLRQCKLKLSFEKPADLGEGIRKDTGAPSPRRGEEKLRVVEKKFKVPHLHARRITGNRSEAAAVDSDPPDPVPIHPLPSDQQITVLILIVVVQRRPGVLEIRIQNRSLSQKRTDVCTHTYEAFLDLFRRSAVGGGRGTIIQYKDEEGDQGMPEELGKGESEARVGMLELELGRNDAMGICSVPSPLCIIPSSGDGSSAPLPITSAREENQPG